MSTEQSQARDASALNSTNNGVAVPPQKDGTPPTSDALANIPTSSHDNVHHLYAGMHSLIDTLVCTPSSRDR